MSDAAQDLGLVATPAIPAESIVASGVEIGRGGGWSFGDLRALFQHLPLPDQAPVVITVHGAGPDCGSATLRTASLSPDRTALLLHATTQPAPEH